MRGLCAAALTRAVAWQHLWEATLRHFLGKCTRFIEFTHSLLLHLNSQDVGRSPGWAGMRMQQRGIVSLVRALARGNSVPGIASQLRRALGAPRGLGSRAVVF